MTEPIAMPFQNHDTRNINWQEWKYTSIVSDFSYI